MICIPSGKPPVVNPHGTDNAGSPVTVIREHERIHSMYVVMGTPSISGIHSTLTSNGGTWVTGAHRMS